MKLNMVREKYTGLDNRTYVKWTEASTTGEIQTRPFTIVASPSGISIRGAMLGEIENVTELQEFAKIISEAQIEQRKLRPQLVPG